FRGGLRPRRNRLHAHDFISSSCWRARCTSSRRLDQMCAISSPSCGIFCSSIMLPGRVSGTGTIICTFPGCAVITMLRFPRNTASSTEWVMNTTVFLCSLPDVEQLLLQQEFVLRVERREWLVHQQNFGIVGKRTCDRHALAHAAGKLVGIVLGETGETGAREIVADHLLDGGGWRGPAP